MYIIGRNPILEALRAGSRIAKIYVRFGVHGGSVDELRRLAASRRIPISVLPKQKFDRIAPTASSQGVAALVEDVTTLSIDDLLDAAVEQDPHFFIALDAVKDPHNVGAILRSAECAGAHGVILPSRDSAMINDTVMKTSAGAAAHIPIARVGNLRQALDTLKNRGVWIVGLDADGGTDLLSFDGSMPLCIVIGSERGMHSLVKKSCDVLVRIPMWGRIDSLNASVAAALMLYEVRRKRL